jgi:hypothetical protein
MKPLDELEQIEDQAEFVAREFEALGMARGAAYERSRAQAEMVIRRNNLDENAPEYYFKPGDWVKMKNHDKKKLEFDWKGPYFIDQIGYPGTYWVRKMNGERLPNTVNQRELAPWLAVLNQNEDYAYYGNSRAIAEDSNSRGELNVIAAVNDNQTFGYNLGPYIHAERVVTQAERVQGNIKGNDWNE